MRTSEFFIGCLKLDVIDNAYLVEVSYVDAPPRQDRLSDLPEWALSSKNAIWFVRENESILKRARNGEQIREDLLCALAP